MDCTKRNFQESVNYCKDKGSTIASFHSNEDIKKGKDVLQSSSCRQAYIGAISDGSGNWRWLDDSDWWEYRQNDGLAGTSETKIVWDSDGKWNDWGTGAAKMGVICKAGNFTRFL